MEENGSLTRFTPHGVNWVIFLMEYKLENLEPTTCFFVLYVDKHAKHVSMKALNFIKVYFRNNQGILVQCYKITYFRSNLLLCRNNKLKTL